METTTTQPGLVTFEKVIDYLVYEIGINIDRVRVLDMNDLIAFYNIDIDDLKAYCK